MRNESRRHNDYIETVYILQHYSLMIILKQYVYSDMISSIVL